MLDIQFGPTSLSTEDRIVFFRTLGSWLTSGGGHTSVADAVKNTCDTFSYDEYKTLKPKMDTITREYVGGQVSLAQALRSVHVGFKKQELAIIEAAEKSSQLRMAVPSLVEALDIQHKGRKLLVGSMTMPLMVGFALILMSLGVLIIMLPMVIGPVVERRPDALYDFPAILRWYWFTSVWLRANYPIPTAVAVIPILIFVFKSVPIVKRQLDKFLMWLKPSRRMIITFNGVLSVFFMPALVRSGMPGHAVLDALAECVSHPNIAGMLRGAAQEHRNGMRMGEAVKVLPFRTSFANAVSTGEQTGQIAERVEELKEPYRLDLERQISQTVSVLKFFVMAILLPFFVVTTYTSLVGPIFALMEY
ncbi:MAG: type II secretion system F family protein [Alphaproteobacteria bacterium]|nr:type II secretion system F family protein [Alphaproteobacteria bacterium]MDD9920362.1 type II secretion system F family protein [Alphaproteobacteria bacterium]